MSVFSYIEVVEEKNKYKQAVEDEELFKRFSHGFGWWYLIAVAGGSYLYQGKASTNDPNLMQEAEVTAKLFYEQNLPATLRNYRIAIKACEQALGVGIDEIEDKYKEDLGLLQGSYEWFLRAYEKLPNGIVRVDWAEGVWGQSHEALREKSKFPSGILQYFRDLIEDTKKYQAGRLTEEAFLNDYQDKQELNI